MKNLRKIIIVLLCMIFSVSVIGCNEDDDDQRDGDEVTLSQTNIDFINNGESDYKIVISNSPEGYEAYAASQLSDFVFESSAITLNVLSESEVTVSEQSKLLIIGQTQLTKNANVSAPKADYGARGFVIKRQNTNVYMVGGDTMGTLYAVYEFLHHQLGYEPYAIDEYSLEKGVRDSKLVDFNMSEIPDIAHMQAVFEFWTGSNHTVGHTLRYNHFTEVFVNATGQPWHNTFEYVPQNGEAQCDCHSGSGLTYMQAHPKWYAQDGKQLHYTAHGDAEELQALEDTIFKRMVYFIERDFADNKYYEHIGFMQEDTNAWPGSDYPYNQGAGEVDSVAVLKEKYGNAYASAMLVHFINPLQERISQYMKENHDDRKMSIVFFAYQLTEPAPVKTVNGKIVPIDDSVVVHPDANVFIALIRANYIKDYEECGYTSTTEGWKVLAKNFSFWYYEYYFNTCSIPYLDSTYSLQSYVRAARDVHATYLFFETPLNSNNYYPFGSLKTYLISKLGWDVDVSVQPLIDAFFQNYYKNAADTMQEYFDSLTTYMAYIKNNTSISGVTGSVGGDITAYWNEGVLQGWMELIDKAYDDIEILKYTDKNLYDKLYDRILYDSIMPRYLLLKHFAKEAFTDESFAEEFAQWKADCKSLGVEKANAYVIIEDLVLTR